MLNICVIFAFQSRLTSYCVSFALQNSDIALYLLELLFQTRYRVVIVLVNFSFDLDIVLVKFFQLVINQSFSCLELFIIELFLL